LTFCTAVWAVVLIITILTVVKGGIAKRNITVIFLYVAINVNLLCNDMTIVFQFLAKDDWSLWTGLAEIFFIYLAIFTFVARTMDSFSKIAIHKALFKCLFFLCWAILIAHTCLFYYFFLKNTYFNFSFYYAISSMVIAIFLIVIYIVSSIEMYRLTGKFMWFAEKTLTAFLLTLIIGQIDISIYSLMKIYAKNSVNWNSPFSLLFVFSTTILIEIIPGLLLTIQISRKPKEQQSQDSTNEPLNR